MKKIAIVFVTLVLIGCGDQQSSRSAADNELIIPAPSPDTRDDSNLVEVNFSENEEIAIEKKVSQIFKGSTGFDFDNSLTRAQKLQIKKDLIDIAVKQYEPPQNKYFAATFGSADADSVLDYLRQRIKVYLGERTNPVMVSSLNNTNPGAYLTAQNFGTLIWYNGVLTGNKGTVQGSAKRYPVTSMRAGIITILQGYTAMQKNTLQATLAQPRRLASAATLIHEARHSDCSEALSLEEIREIRETKDLLRGNPKCGHLHVTCPQDFGSLAGINACDTHFWGAYSLSGLYNQMVEQLCLSCTEIERETARMGRIDSMGRVLAFRELAEGQSVPLPDMGHRETSLP